MDDVTQIAAGGMFAIMVIKEVFSFLKSKKPNGNGHSNGVSSGETKELLKMSSQLDELHRMHSVRDLDGRPIWYFPTHLEAHIEELSSNIDKLTRAVERLSDELRDTHIRDFRS